MCVANGRVSSALAFFVVLWPLIVSATPDGALCSEKELTCVAPSGKVSTGSVRTAWAMRRSNDLGDVGVAVLPLGSIEQHGPHLPLGTDMLLAEAFASCISKNFGSRISVLPASPYGASFEHAAFPGTLPVPDDALQALWGSIIVHIAKAGVRSVILLNGHGGQTPNAQIAARKARFELGEPVLVTVINLQALIHDSREIIIESKIMTEDEWDLESRHGIHGGVVETSLMMCLHPGTVDTAAASHFPARAASREGTFEPHGNVVSYGWEAQDISASGAIGNASAATRDAGCRIFEHASRELLRIVSDIARQDASELFQNGYSTYGGSTPSS